MFIVAPLQSSLAVGGVNDGVAVQSIVALAPAAPIVGAVYQLAVITCGLLLSDYHRHPLHPMSWCRSSRSRVTALHHSSMFTVAPLQSSLAVGGVKCGEAVQSIVALAPACTNRRRCVSML